MNREEILDRWDLVRDYRKAKEELEKAYHDLEGVFGTVKEHTPQSLDELRFVITDIGQEIDKVHAELNAELAQLGEVEIG